VKKIVGLAAIDREIKAMNGVLANVNTRVQSVAVAIIEHAAGAGNGDVSRALTLCQMVRKHRTLNVAYLVGYFAAFAGTNVNLNKGTVNLFARDSKKQRGFRVEEARANNWYEAIDAEGNRAAWYAGPTPQDYVPDGIGDIAEQMLGFVERINKRLDGTKTVNGKEVPLVRLEKEDEEQVHNALSFIERIAATLARHEEVALLQARLAEATAATEQDEAVVEVIRQPVAKAG
jgi:hypothetical protein